LLFDFRCFLILIVFAFIVFVFFIVFLKVLFSQKTEITVTETG